MPFKSEKQRRFMWANHPDIARKWAHGKHSAKGKARRRKTALPKADARGYY